MDTGSMTRPPQVPTASDEGEPLAGRYRLEGLIGRGGMAEVYAARDEVLRRRVAVKVFPFLGSPETHRGSGHDEVRLLASLNHPGLVTVHDAGTPSADTPAFLVMELVPGPTLSVQLRQHGPLEPSQVAILGSQVAAALAYVHWRNLIHRDVKPGNILLREPLAGPDTAPVAKLADFGIARLVDATRVTRSGTALGTAPYLSPEQVRGETVGPPSDVYALGLVLLECLTATVAYPGSAIESAVARLHRAPDIPEDLDPDLRDLLVAMTHTDPAQRPGAAEVTEALAALAPDHVMTTQTSPVGLLGAASPTRRRDRARTVRTSPWQRFRRLTGRARLVTAGSVAALVVLLAAGWVVLTPPPSPAAPVRPAPSYPAVPGALGTDLQQLQKAVQR